LGFCARFEHCAVAVPLTTEVPSSTNVTETRPGFASFSTGIDSPVSADSWRWRSVAFQQARVGRHEVAGTQPNDVTRDDRDASTSLNTPSRSAVAVGATTPASVGSGLRAKRLKEVQRHAERKRWTMMIQR